MFRKLFIGSLLFLISLALSCVDKVDISLPPGQLAIIVDGMVTDQPGPDTVKITRAYPADGTAYPRFAVVGAGMTIADDTGFVDRLIDIGRGYYVTNLLTGTVGRTYRLTIQLPQPYNTTVTSSPQLMLPAGSVDSIFYEFTSRTNPETGQPDNGFNIFINSTLSSSSSGRVQWNFMGTYRITTDPAAVLPVPPPCAAGCECCTCYVHTSEGTPIVSNPHVTKGTQLSRVFMQYIPINKFTFYEKYRVEITQVELNEEVFEFYQAIQKQASNSSSLFQPPFFELKGNMTVLSGPVPVVGTFAASALAKRYIYIPRAAVPFKPSFALTPGDCRNIASRSYIEIPPYWE